MTTRDWSKDVEGTDVRFIDKVGEYVYCEHLGFEFKIHRSAWPATRFSPNNCLTPNEFYKFQVRHLHGIYMILLKYNIQGQIIG